MRMSRVLLAVLTVITSCASRVSASPTGDTPPDGSQTHRVTLNHDADFTLSWTPRENDVVFEVSAATTGYIGIGFSSNGGMKGADIVLGWVDDVTGEPVLHDRHASGYMIPTIDESQDVLLLGGQQNATHTMLKFSRAWDTCDRERDMKLSNDTVRVIWAYGVEDPKGEMTMNIHAKRGSKSMFLTEPPFIMPELSDDVKAWDLIGENVSLPNELDTIYWCKLFKFPSMTKKVHYIGYVPVVEERNREHVHHLVVYECRLKEGDKYFEHWLGVKGTQCYSKNMPLTWRACSNPIVAWGTGSEGEMFPEHVGFPLGEEHGGTSYFMMEVHYDNPNLRQDVVDSSGVRMFYTEKLRQYDAGNIAIGHGISPLHIIPPKQMWLTNGHCVSECTKSALPAEGIHVFHGLLHSHLLGSAMVLRQIRNGKEIPPMLKDMAYDFDFQQSRILKKEMDILQGDHLIMECVYDTKQKRLPSYGGLGTNEEMCLAFLSYYPKTDLGMCSSHPTLDEIREIFDFEELYGEDEEKKKGKPGSPTFNEVKEREMAQEMMKSTYEMEYHSLLMKDFFKTIKAKTSKKYKDKTLYDVLNNEVTWQDQDLTDRLYNATRYGTHRVECLRGLGAIARKEKDTTVPSTTTYPTFIHYEEEDLCEAK